MFYHTYIKSKRDHYSVLYWWNWDGSELKTTLMSRNWTQPYSASGKSLFSFLNSDSRFQNPLLAHKKLLCLLASKIWACTFSCPCSVRGLPSWLSPNTFFVLPFKNRIQAPFGGCAHSEKRYHTQTCKWTGLSEHKWHLATFASIVKCLQALDQWP